MLLSHLRKKKIKIVVGGNGAVGKTIICQRLAQKFSDTTNESMTIGLDFHTLKTLDDKQVNGQLWDLGGQEQYHCFHDSWFKGAKIVLIVFAVDLIHSYLSIDYWLSFIPNIDKISLYLIGNKIDSEDRQIEYEEALSLAQEKNIKYFEVSAKTGQGFTELESQLYYDISQTLNQDSLIDYSTLSSNKKKILFIE